MPTIPEIFIIVLIVVLVFTAGRLSDLGDGIGRLIHGAPEPSLAPEPEGPIEQEELD